MRHREGRKRIGKVVIAVTALTILLMVGLVICGRGRWSLTSSRRLPNRYDGEIKVFQSDYDKDKDGIEDQRDILESALAYTQTRPVYQSKYYGTGYPDDAYGVCTDVVAQGLKGAGYDLMVLVEEDILSDPQAYGIEEPDPNIDFRRVRNLLCFFERNSLSLTTDIGRIDEWQGGDIVVFSRHIGIVSDRRNAKGIPYVIHHSGPCQRRYEEDILEKRQDIVGHYRVEGR